MSKTTKQIIGWLIGLGVFGWVVYWAVTAPRIPATEYEATNGLHYHPHLVISANGEQMTIPANIGLIGGHNPMHTHDADNVIHLEFTGRVKKDDLRLGKFFDLWGKEWTEGTFMGMPMGGHMLTMKVNGATSTEYRQLLMQDKQEIELIYR